MKHKLGETQRGRKRESFIKAEENYSDWAQNIPVSFLVAMAKREVW